MASSYIFAVAFVMARLVLASYGHDVTPSFTVMNYLPVEDFMTLYCHCVDEGGSVTTVGATLGDCVDKLFELVTCPSGEAVTTVFCNFKYYQRNRKVSPSTISPKYTNVQVWTSTGPPRIYYQLAPDGVYGSTTDKYFDLESSNKVADWRALYEGSNVDIMRDKSVGNGRSFR